MASHSSRTTMSFTSGGQSWQPVGTRDAKNLLQCTTPEGHKEYHFAKAPNRAVGHCKTSADPRKAMKYGLRAHNKRVKQQATGANKQGIPAPGQQPAVLVPGPQTTQLLHADTKRPALPQSASVSKAAPSTDAEPATPALKKASHTWSCVNSSSGSKIPWAMHVTAAGPKQSGTEDVIMVTPVKHIKTDFHSVLWSASVPLCSPHGLATVKNPPPSLISLLEKHKSCGKCCIVGLAQQLSSSSSSSSSAGVEGAGDGSGVQAAAGCSCTLPVAFKFARPFAQLHTGDKKAYGTANAYVASVQSLYDMEWGMMNGASSTGSNVLSWYALGELRNGSHVRPCMLLELESTQLGDASVMQGPPGSPAASPAPTHTSKACQTDATGC